ncbi:MAG: fatty acid desaturase, partial [Chloroflexota bacterium]
LVQLLTINLLTQAGRTFGKGGLISTIYVTILGAFGKVGSLDIPSQEWLQALHEDQPELHQSAIWWDRFLLLFHGTVVITSILSGYWVFIFIISISPIIGNWGIYYLGITQHTGLKDKDEDIRKCTLSVRVNFLAEFLYWRMNWHTEHHMFAGIPCYNLKKLYSEIADQMPEPRTLAGAWQEMRATWYKQKEDPDYYFDTPVPAIVQTQRGRRSDHNLESSIGDLAPKGLR